MISARFQYLPIILSLQAEQIKARFRLFVMRWKKNLEGQGIPSNKWKGMTMPTGFYWILAILLCMFLIGKIGYFMILNEYGVMEKLLIFSIKRNPGFNLAVPF